MTTRPTHPSTVPYGASMDAPKAGVKVRMYRTGLGDCFLLALPRVKPDHHGRESFHILVDCGVFFQTPAITHPDTGKLVEQEDWIREIAEHIKQSTDGRIDVLIITHEHWDHVSGFHEDQAQAVFETIELGALWLAWTEDMSIKLARKLKQEGGADHETLVRAIEAMQKRRGMKDSSAYKMSEKMLGFFGAKAGSEKKYSKETARAMEWIWRDYAGKFKIEPSYLRPGHCPALDGVDPELARVYVLGPPKNEKVIKVCNRTGTTYRMGIDWSAAAACFVAFGVSRAAGGDAARAREMNVPFERRYQHPLAWSEKVSNMFFHKHYFNKDEHWRRIDHDWAEPAAAFALQLDNKTNNTSLAFALEIGPPGEGKVLLFPGDAQVGNWLSWFGPVKVHGEKEPIGKTLKWTAGDKTVTAADLMRRTVLYKVGHHGSHNATLRTRDKQPSGLELMESKELVAMIPVDEFVARNKAGYGDMPLPEIVAELLRRTGGKVTRNDEDAKHSNDETPVLNGVGIPAGLEMKKFKGKQKTGLYIECEVEL